MMLRKDKTAESNKIKLVIDYIIKPLSFMALEFWAPLMYSSCDINI